MPKKSAEAFWRDIVRAVMVAAIVGLGGAAAKTYMTAHDTALKVEEQNGKIEWLYNYMFPKDTKHESANHQ